MSDLRKYPRTRHVRGSRFQHGDHDLSDMPWSELAGKHLVVEEKIDGSNCGVSFDERGNLLLQSRGHYLRGGPRERQFDLLKQWTMAHAELLYCSLEDRYVMYAEWMFAKHTVFYDALPHYFMEFDLYDKTQGVFLSTMARRAHYRSTGLDKILCSVPVLHEGPVLSIDQLSEHVGVSSFKTPTWRSSLISAALRAGVSNVEEHTDLSDEMEGLYVKIEDEHTVLDRCKYVRQTFTSSILDQETHWHDRPIVQNMLNRSIDELFIIGDSDGKVSYV